MKLSQHYTGDICFMIKTHLVICFAVWWYICHYSEMFGVDSKAAKQAQAWKMLTMLLLVKSLHLKKVFTALFFHLRCFKYFIMHKHVKKIQSWSYRKQESEILADRMEKGQERRRDWGRLKLMLWLVRIAISNETLKAALKISFITISQFFLLLLKINPRPLPRSGCLRSSSRLCS